MKRLLAISLAVVLTVGLSTVLLPAQPTMASPENTVYVDVNNTTGSENGTQAYPYISIQKGIDAALALKDGTVLVAPGTYYENIEMEPKVIIQGSGANVTFIDGGSNGSVVTANSVDSDAKLDGFTITNGSELAGGGIFVCINSSPTISSCNITGNTATFGGGICVDDNSSPTISNCLITGNTAGAGGGGIFVSSSSPTLTNCTFTGNSATEGGGMYNFNSSPTVTNCILWGDADPEISDVGPSPTVTYSCVQNGYPENGYPGIGNILLNPLFVNSEAGDYHLQSGSPCIDKGSNDAPGLPETDADGNPRIVEGDGYGLVATVDMGAYEAIITITATAGPGGSIDPSGEVIVGHSANQTFAITADTGYHIADVVVDGVSVGQEESYTFSNVTAAHTIHATFAITTTTLGTRSLGFYKNHPAVVVELLVLVPQELGGDSIDFEQAMELLWAKPKGEHKIILERQLLVTKFNVAIFGIGRCQWEETGPTIDDIITSADALLQAPEATKSALSAMADLLDEINNAGTDVPLPPPYEELARPASPPAKGKGKGH